MGSQIIGILLFDRFLTHPTFLLTAWIRIMDTVMKGGGGSEVDKNNGYGYGSYSRNSNSLYLYPVLPWAKIILVLNKEYKN